jgi:hypothetical protein
VFLKKLSFLLKIFIYILDRLDVLILKIIFKNKKYIILIHFRIKNILKNNHNRNLNSNFIKYF